MYIVSVILPDENEPKAPKIIQATEKFAHKLKKHWRAKLEFFTVHTVGSLLIHKGLLSNLEKGSTTSIYAG